MTLFSGVHPRSRMHRTSSSQNSSSDVSQARLAAEDAFTAQPSSDIESIDAPVVLVKRNRTIAASDENKVKVNAGREHVEEARAPRVYLIEPTLSAGLPNEGSDQSRLTVSSDFGEAVSSQTVFYSKRRHRPKKHGEVRVIRPDYANTLDGTAWSADGQNDIATLRRRMQPRTRPSAACWPTSARPLASSLCVYACQLNRTEQVSAMTSP